MKFKCKTSLGKNEDLKELFYYGILAIITLVTVIIQILFMVFGAYTFLFKWFNPFIAGFLTFLVVCITIFLGWLLFTLMDK